MDGEHGGIAGPIEIQAARILAVAHAEAGDADALESFRGQAEGLASLLGGGVVVERQQRLRQERVASARAVAGVPATE